MKIGRIAGALAALVLFSGPAIAAPCETAVADRLAEVGINQGDVRVVDIRAVVEDRGEGKSLLGWQAWVRFQSCTGALIVDLTDYCYVQQVYTRDGCRQAGVSNW